MNLASLRGLILPIVGFLAVTGGLIYAIQTIGLENIRTFIETAGPLAPLVYIAIKAATYVFAPLTSGPIQFGAGILFGLVPGTLYTLVGELIGGSISFMIARHLGRPVVRRLAGDDGLARIDRFVNQIVDWKTLTYARLFLFSIYDFISYAVGFTRLNFRTYVIVSAVAGFFPTFAAVAVGSVLTAENSGILILYVGVALVCALPLVFQKHIRRLLKMEKLHDAAQAAD